MEIKLFRNWWLMTLKGVLAIGYGVYILISQFTLVTTLLAKIFGIIILLSGILIIVGSFLHKRSNPRWAWWLIEGIVDITIGLFFVFKPQWAKAFILAIMAFWACIIGLIQIITALRLKIYMHNWWTLVFTGVCSILVAVTIFINPFVEQMTKISVVAIASIVFGLIMTYLSHMLKDIYLKY